MCSLEGALERYQRIQALAPTISPQAIDADAADAIFDLYIQAYVLELGYRTLLTALMPKTGTELVTAALKSIGNEVVATVPLSGQLQTLTQVYKLEKQMNELSASLQAFQPFTEALTAALRTVDEANKTIALSANAAVNGCP